MTPRGRRAIVIVEFAIAENAALIVLVTRTATLTELVVTTESSRRWLTVIAVVVGILVGSSATSRHCGRMSWTCTRCATPGRPRVARRSRSRRRVVTRKSAARTRHRHRRVKAAAFTPRRNPSNHKCTRFKFLIMTCGLKLNASYVNNLIK